MSFSNASLQSWQLRSLAASEVANAPLPPSQIEMLGSEIRLSYATLPSGPSAGMTCLMIDTGGVTASILPDRGMGIWKCWAGDLEFGWQSPVQGPVHPCFVPVHDATGIGWLEGFDELLVRCGLYSNGAPEFTEKGTVKHPLHGRIANLPAHRLDVQADIEKGTLDVIGVVAESRFLVYSLELQTRYRFRVGSPNIEITDTVTNRSSQRGSMQMLYHINIGQPILQSGSSVHIPFRKLAPRDRRAAEGIEQWNRCEGPVSGFQEQVYFIEPYADESHWSEAMLASSDRTFGFSVQFDTRTLPFLSLWKNTAAVEDGYVVGLEPATGFPNVRSVEECNGRVVVLQGGESKSFRTKLLPLQTANDVTQSIGRIDKLQVIQGAIG